MSQARAGRRRDAGAAVPDRAVGRRRAALALWAAAPVPDSRRASPRPAPLRPRPPGRRPHRPGLDDTERRRRAVRRASLRSKSGLMWCARRSPERPCRPGAALFARPPGHLRALRFDVRTGPGKPGYSSATRGSRVSTRRTAGRARRSLPTERWPRTRPPNAAPGHDPRTRPPGTTLPPAANAATGGSGEIAQASPPPDSPGGAAVTSSIRYLATASATTDV
jgi:hypothetical protein